MRDRNKMEKKKGLLKMNKRTGRGNVTEIRMQGRDVIQYG